MSITYALTFDSNEQLQAVQRILDERAFQDSKWGGWEHDKHHSQDDWERFLGRHLERAMWSDDVTFRRQMARVAALALAALEWSQKTGRGL